MLDSWLQLDAASLVYEKELLPVGKLVRWVGDAKDVLDTVIQRPFLDNLVLSFKRMKGVGVRVPIFKTHHEDPDNKRGQVEDLYVKKNSKGVDSLFLKGRFDNENAVQLAMNNDVSALIPPKFVDGKGNTYTYPLRHVAITSNPVVPGLAPWHGPVVLAFELASGVPIPDDGKGGIAVEKLLNSLASELSLDFTDGEELGSKLQKVLDGVKELKASQKEEDVVQLDFPPMLVRQSQSYREKEIDALVLDRTISASMGDKLKKRYCSEEAIQLDLSMDTDKTQFERDVEFAKELVKDRPLPTSGRQTIKLSTEDGKDNPLIADAKARAASQKSA